MPGDRQQLRRAVMAVAADQAGYFTAAQALQVGYSYQAQKFHVDHGNWQRVDRGLFRIPEWPTDDDDSFVRWTVWSRGVAVVSHLSAMAWHQLGDANPDRLHVTVPKAFRRTDPALVVHREELPAADIEDHGNFRITTPLRCVVEVADEGGDQGLVDGAVADVMAREQVDARRIRDAAAVLGPRAELGVERALAALKERR